MTTRAIRRRLALASQRATRDLADSDHSSPAPRSDEPIAGSIRAELALDAVLAVLDDLAEDADALNARIEALLADGWASR
jgi:hypothetical protein